MEKNISVILSVSIHLNTIWETVPWLPNHFRQIIQPIVYLQWPANILVDFCVDFPLTFLGELRERDKGNEARAYWSDRLTFWESVVVRRWCGAQRGRKDKWQSTNILTCPQMSFNELPAATPLSKELIFSNDLHIPFCAQNAPHITHFSWLVSFLPTQHTY